MQCLQILNVKNRIMIQTLEATVDETGKIRVPTEIRLEKSRRALMTIYLCNSL